MAITAKHKIRYPVAGDSAAALATYFANLANDVDSKLPHPSALPYFGKNYIASGAALTNPSGLNVAVSAGVANINGVTFDFVTSGNLLMAASATNRIWLTATFDVNGFLTGYTWVVRNDTFVPANSVMVGEVVTAAAAPTTMANVSTYRGVIAPGVEIARGERTTNTVAGAAATAIIGTLNPIVMDGVTPVEIEAYAGSFVQSVGGAGQYQEWFLHNDTSVAKMATLSGNSHIANYALPLGKTGMRVPVQVGARTFSHRVFSSSGTTTLNAAVDNPSWIRAFFSF